LQPVRPDCWLGAGGQEVQDALTQGSGGGGENDCLIRDRVEDGRQRFQWCLRAGDEIGGAGQGLAEQFLGVRVVR
jgi:hypothetical protein